MWYNLIWFVAEHPPKAGWAGSLQPANRHVSSTSGCSVSFAHTHRPTLGFLIHLQLCSQHQNEKGLLDFGFGSIFKTI